MGSSTMYHEKRSQGEVPRKSTKSLVLIRWQGVIHCPEKNIAITNGQSYEEDEEMKGCKILKIEPCSVYLQCSKGRSIYRIIGDH